GQVGYADARPLVLGLRIPQLELSPRASLFRRRPVLPVAGAAAGARAVLCAARHAMADLLGAAVRLAGGESRAAHRLVDARSTWRRAQRCCCSWPRWPPLTLGDGRVEFLRGFSTD